MQIYWSSNFSWLSTIHFVLFSFCTIGIWCWCMYADYFCSAYDFKKNEKIIALFNNFDYYLSEESLWQLSEMIKPRGSKTPVKPIDWKHWISDFCLLIDFPCVNRGICLQLGARGLWCWSLLTWLESISQSINLWHCQWFELILFICPDGSFSKAECFAFWDDHLPGFYSQLVTWPVESGGH